MSSKSEETSSIYTSSIGKTKRTVGENTHRLLRLIWTYVAHNYLLILQVIKMNSTTSKKTMEELRKLFSQFGLPLVIVSDNGPQFVSIEFENFIQQNVVKHILIPAYHPASNGQAESLVGKFKACMKKIILSYPDIMFNVSNW